MRERRQKERAREAEQVRKNHRGVRAGVCFLSARSSSAQAERAAERKVQGL